MFKSWFKVMYWCIDVYYLDYYSYIYEQNDAIENNEQTFGPDNLHWGISQDPPPSDFIGQTMTGGGVGCGGVGYYCNISLILWKLHDSVKFKFYIIVWYFMFIFVYMKTSDLNQNSSCEYINFLSNILNTWWLSEPERPRRSIQSPPCWIVQVVLNINYR